MNGLKKTFKQKLTIETLERENKNSEGKWLRRTTDGTDSWCSEKGSSEKDLEQPEHEEKEQSLI